MTTDTARPLPLDIATLRNYYMPLEPTGTTVDAWRTTIANLDAATAFVHAALAEADARQSEVVTQLVDAAAEGRDLAKILAEYRPGRVHAQQRLDLLALARGIAANKHARAVATDPALIAWRQQCEQVTAEWWLAGSGDTPEARYAGVTAFAAAH